jgi:hypothetical protein
VCHVFNVKHANFLLQVRLHRTFFAKYNINFKTDTNTIFKSKMDTYYNCYNARIEFMLPFALKRREKKRLSNPTEESLVVSFSTAISRQVAEPSDGFGV